MLPDTFESPLQWSLHTFTKKILSLGTNGGGSPRMFGTACKSSPGKLLIMAPITWLVDCIRHENLLWHLTKIFLVRAWYWPWWKLKCFTHTSSFASSSTLSASFSSLSWLQSEHWVSCQYCDLLTQKLKEFHWNSWVKVFLKTWSYRRQTACLSWLCGTC